MSKAGPNPWLAEHPDEERAAELYRKTDESVERVRAAFFDGISAEEHRNAEICALKGDLSVRDALYRPMYAAMDAERIDRIKAWLAEYGLDEAGTKEKALWWRQRFPKGPRTKEDGAEVWACEQHGWTLVRFYNACRINGYSGLSLPYPQGDIWAGEAARKEYSRLKYQEGGAACT